MDMHVILSMFERPDPLDRLHLARLSKAFWCILISDIPKPLHGLSEPAWANMAFVRVCQQIRRNFFSARAYTPHVCHYIRSPLLILNALLNVSELMRGTASGDPHSNIALDLRACWKASP
ncbi:uncharacterized protein ARMOST_18967 [Armillaria ostoyae]|uniref:F-box domain-containing protein n=1 Tax=Armillaria ostoyae TaxID=47428 RepID=A0A284S3A9_ARMOS|nr:uncharacterized protein ARMOST_18967 [Armillaria ostoyae]